MATTSIFQEKGPFYYPFTNPLTGNIDELCNNPVNYDCVLNTSYQSTNCGTNYKPVLDCGVGTTAVCCPETIFPYAKSTAYCTYLTNQGCFTHQTANVNISQTLNGAGNGITYGGTSTIPCPDSTYNITDCGLCCPKDITNNMNFTEEVVNPLDPIGSLWNQDTASLPNGIYKIMINGNCMTGNGSDLTLYLNSPSSYTAGQYPGECGPTWQVTKMGDEYIGEGIYPSADLKYVPGGHTIQNVNSGLYLTMSTSPFNSEITPSLSPTPSVVNIFANTDGTYRIQNAKNQIDSFNPVGNIGNPINCLVVGDNNTFESTNWENGLTGLPCGINGGTDQQNYKFQFISQSSQSSQSTNPPQIQPSQLSNGEYYIEVEDHVNFVNNVPTNNCIDASGNVSNYGGAVGTCGTVTPRFQLDTNYRWVLTNEKGGISLENVVNGFFIQEPIIGQPISVGPTKAILNIGLNPDGSYSIMNRGINQACLVVNGGKLEGYNWYVSDGICGTGYGSTLTSYKFNFVPAPPPIIPPVSPLPSGDGIYEIDTTNNMGMLFEQTTGGGTLSLDPSCFEQCKPQLNSIPNILEMSGKYTPTNTSQQRWLITSTTDNNGNKGYVVKNEFSNRYITVSNGFGQVLTTSTTPEILYLYLNPDNSYTIQSANGACITQTSQQYASSISGNNPSNYNYTASRSNQSANACGVTNPPSSATYTLKFIGAPASQPTLTGYGGNCTYTWYTSPTASTLISNFSDGVSCNNAITTSINNAYGQYGITPPTPTNVYGLTSTTYSGGPYAWNPFFSPGEAHILFTYMGKCLSVDGNGNVIASDTCTKTVPNAQQCTLSGNTEYCSAAPIVNQPWYWVFNPETDSSGNDTGNYYVTNQSTGQYLVIPSTTGTNSLTTTTTPTAVGIKLTYPTFGKPLNSGNNPNNSQLQPTSYYFHLIAPGSDTICAFATNSGTEAISWGTNTGLVSGYPAAPVSQLQQQVLYECGTDPTKIESMSTNAGSPSVNYQFTVDGYCLKDIVDQYNTPLCFNDDGTIVSGDQIN